MKKLPYIFKSLISLGVIVLFALSSTPSKAQNAVPLTVVPSRQQFSVDPGQSEYFNIKFVNQSTSPLYGNLKVVDFLVLDNEGTPTLLDDVKDLSSRYSGASWVYLPSDKASVPAGGILTLQLKMQVPEDARPGGRYVAISFEPTGVIPSATGEGEEGTLGISQRIVGLIYVRVNGPISEDAFIEKFKVPTLVQFGPINLTFDILNRGDYHITPKGQVTLTNWFGVQVDSKLLDAKNVFPDVSRSYETPLGEKWLLGRYKVNLTASYGESGRVLNQTAYVWAFPWMLALMILFAIAIVVLIVVLIKQKFTKKEKILEAQLTAERKEVEELKQKYEDKSVDSNPPSEE